MKNIFLGLVTFFGVVFCFVPRANAILLFSDSFDGIEAEPEWGNETGNWIVNNIGHNYKTISGGGGWSSVTSLPYLTDFSVSFSTDPKSGGAYLRSSDDQNGVILVTGGKANTFSGVYWHTVVNGDYGEILNPVEISDFRERFHFFRIDVTGNKYELFIDSSSSPITTLITDKFAYGKFALFSGGFDQRYDDVAIYGDTSTFAVPQPNVPEPSTVFLLGSGLIRMSFKRRWQIRNKPI